MEGPEITFLFQFGVLRDTVTVLASTLNLKSLKDLACDFINSKMPDNGLNKLGDRLLLFRHEYSSPNVLQIINSAAEVCDETLIEIVLTANTKPASSTEELFPVRPHALVVHSYKAPTFCDFCGEMLFGLVRQGLKCEGCGLNYHKRCAVKIPNNCAVTNLLTSGNRRSSSLLHAGTSSAGSSASLISDEVTCTSPGSTGNQLVRKMQQLMNDITS